MVINPSTPVAALNEVLDIADYVLIMSVNPGFGGQQFIPNALIKARQLAQTREERGLQFTLEIDGGITRDNLADVVNAGVEWVVAGSSVFHGGNSTDSFPAANYVKLRQAAREAALVRVTPVQLKAE